MTTSMSYSKAKTNKVKPCLDAAISYGHRGRSYAALGKSKAAWDDIYMACQFWPSSDTRLAEDMELLQNLSIQLGYNWQAIEDGIKQARGSK